MISDRFKTDGYFFRVEQPPSDTNHNFPRAFDSHSRSILYWRSGF